jgi:ribosomal protein S18 acetylase RimI-like enzyme
MLIRPATAADARSIARIHVLAWQAAYRGVVPDAHLNGLSVVDYEVRWTNILASDGTNVFVAEDPTEVIGWITYGVTRDDDASPGTGELYALNVLPARWSTGVGRALWRRARQELVELGFGRVTLWVLAANERAIRFYVRLGFQLTVAPEGVVNIGGKSLPKSRYEIGLG